MSQNELPPGSCRIGYAWDADHPDLYPAMLRNHQGRLELTIPFPTDDVSLRRRYIGDQASWGDDPDLTRYNYDLPNQIWFYDTNGCASLVGLRRARGTYGGPTNLAQTTLEIAFAVFTGDAGVDYSKVNGLQAQIEGLDQWIGVRTVTNSLEELWAGEGKDITINIAAPTSLPVDRGLNLTLISGADWKLPAGPGATSITDKGLTQTNVSKARSWEEHLSRHRAVHQLLEISSWRPLGFRNIQTMHAQDPDRLLSGDAIGDRWAAVTTFRLPPVEAPGGTYWFLFAYKDVGARGVRRWLRLREQFSTALDAMTFSIRRQTSLQGRISDAGIGLEAIGHIIRAQRGDTGRVGHHAQLAAIAAEIADLLPFNADEWASRSTQVYNDVKHADRPEAEPNEMLSSLKQNRMVFRLWVARRLGVSDDVLRAGKWLLDRQ